jgi:RimJ/RimL family protein N-acetyltransferase/acyl carrier protein
MPDTQPLELDEFLDRIAAALDLPRERLAPAVRPVDDLGVDSLGVLELIVALEEMGTSVPHEAFDGPVDFSDCYHWYASTLDGSRTQRFQAGQTADGAGATARGPRVVLRPVREVDHASLYRMATSGDGAYRWRLRALAPSEPDLHSVLWDAVLVQLAVARIGRPTPIGLVQAFRASPQGYAFLSVLLEEGARGKGLGFEALALFVDHLFDNFPLRRLYAEAGAFDEADLLRGTGRWFEEHARLPGQLFWQGERWDLLILGVERAAWRRARAGGVTTGART